MSVHLLLRENCVQVEVVSQGGEEPGSPPFKSGGSDTPGRIHTMNTWGFRANNSDSQQQQKLPYIYIYLKINATYGSPVPRHLVVHILYACTLLLKVCTSSIPSQPELYHLNNTAASSSSYCST